MKGPLRESVQPGHNKSITRVALSLRDTHTALPIHLLLSGERFQGAWEQGLVRRLGVKLLDASAHFRVPSWASPFHYASFVKLAALSLTQFRRVILLDTDTVVLRNIDHLASAAAVHAPAFAFRFKCYREPTRKRDPLPIWEMNSGVMVLRPDERLHRRMQRLMNDPGGHVDVWWGGNVSLKGVYVGSDPGDQSVWRSFFHRVHELPIGYNAFKRTRFANASEWRDVSILHDPDVHRNHKLPEPSVEGRYRNVTKRAERLVHAMATEMGVRNRG